MMALEHPERFQRIVVVYEEQIKEVTNYRHSSYGTGTNSDVIGLMETAKRAMFEYMQGRQE